MIDAITVFEGFLGDLDRLEPVKLGGRPTSSHRGPTQQDVNRLKERVSSASSSTTWMLTLTFLLLLSLFAVNLFIVLSLRPTAGAMAATGGGTLVFALVIVERLRRLWVDKAILDVAWAGLEEWEPEHVLSLVELLYWHSLRKARTGSGRQRSTTRRPARSPKP